MNAIDQLAKACADRRLAWNLNGGGAGTYIASVFANWPYKLAMGTGQTPYAAAKAALLDLEKREAAEAGRG